MKASLRGASIAAFVTLSAPSMAASGEVVREPRFDRSIDRLSHAHGVPERLIRRIIMRESRYAPHVTNHGHYGLMQIKLETAKGMGYRGGAAGLLDGETNLTYAVPYLANAYIAAGKDEDRAVQLYAGGYYYVAKHKGLLAKMRTAKSEPVEDTALVAYAEQPQQRAQPSNPFAALFGQSQPQQPTPEQVQQQAAAEGQPAEADPDSEPVDFRNAPLPPRRPANL